MASASPPSTSDLSTPARRPPSPRSSPDLAADDLDADAWNDSAAHGESRGVRQTPLARHTGIKKTGLARKARFTEEFGDGDGEDGADADDEGGEEEDEEEEKRGFLRGGGPSGAETVQDYELYTPAEDRAVLRKLDRKLVLFMGLLYMLSFLDRSNIGNAKIAGLARDLKLSSAQYEWLLTAFYITYIAFEWMTLMYRLVPPHIYISVCVFWWGLLASLQSISSSFSTLLVLRALLGMSEAAFGPGVPFYLSFFFRRDELAFRTGLFISAAPLSTSFASSLAWLITKLGERGPVAPWRVLFLIEGFPSLFVAVWAWSFIPDGPGEASWLTARQREVAVLRLRKEREGCGDEGMMAQRNSAAGRRGVDFREVLGTLMDPKSYLSALMFFSCNVAFSSVPVFLPTIIHDMGYSSITSQALSAPPYLLSFFAVLLTARLSDRFRTRSPFLLFHSLLGASGFSIIALAGLAHTSLSFTAVNALRYAAVYPACAGFFSAVTLIITWTLNNQESDSRKGAGIALLNVVGQCGPLLGTRLFPAGDGPWYVRGMGVCAGFMAAVGVLAAALRWVLVRENRRRRKMGDDGYGDAADAVPLVEGGRKVMTRPFLYML